MRGLIATFYDDSELEFTILLDNPVRGDEARQLAKSWNRFNEVDDDEEFLIVDATLELKKWYSPDDDAFIMSDWDYDYFRSDYSKYRAKNSFVVEGEFFVEAYEGAVVSGKLGFVIPKDDEGYIVLYDKYWWKLTR